TVGVVGARAAPGRHEGVLDDLLGHAGVLHDPTGQPERQPAVAVVQPAERGLVAARDPRDQLPVARLVTDSRARLGSSGQVQRAPGTLSLAAQRTTPTRTSHLSCQSHTAPRGRVALYRARRRGTG